MFGRKKRLTDEELRELFEEIGEIFEEQQKRIEALEKQNKQLSNEVTSIKDALSNCEMADERCNHEFVELKGIVGIHGERIKALEAKRMPVISDLTGNGDKKKPVSTAQIIDEWLNGKREGGDG